MLAGMTCTSFSSSAGIGGAALDSAWRRCFGMSVGCEWLVRVLEANTPAVGFWRTAIARYSRGTCKEEEREVNGRPWRFFRFVSNGASITQ